MNDGENFLFILGKGSGLFKKGGRVRGHL